MSGRLVAAQYLIVQHRGSFIEGDDRVVRQLLFALSAGGGEGLMDVVFGAARPEALLGRPMPPSADTVGLGEAGDFIGSLAASGEIEPSDEIDGVDGRKTPGGKLRKGVADPSGLGEIPG